MVGKTSIQLKIVLFANTDWYLYNFRLSLANALRDRGDDLLLLSPPGEYGKKLVDLGFRWQPLPMERRSLNPIRELSLVFHLWRLVRKEKPDLVHGFTIKCAVYGALAARFARVPGRVSSVAGLGYVFTSSDLKARTLRPLVRALMRFALGGRNARLILQNSDDVAMFKSAGIVAASQIRLIRGSGFDSERFTPPTKKQSQREPTTVLLAARVLWDKGIREYVDAARQLRLNRTDIKFLLAGTPDPGNPAAVPEEEIKAWHEEGIVRWLGHVDDMPTLYQNTDIVVLPSYREGLPKGLIEAAACGLALVATDVPGCREVVTNEVDGLLVPVRDSTALAEAISRLTDNRELARKLGTAARENALGNFDERIVIRQTTSVYQELSPTTQSTE